MAEATEVRAGRRSVSLDVDRVELTGHGSLVIEGRWYGVRGRRFVRPAVMLFAGGERSRLLADIEHKPWAAEDGELWLAVFPWRFDQATDMTDLELTVAPDIVVPLRFRRRTPARRSAAARMGRARSDPPSRLPCAGSSTAPGPSWPESASGLIACKRSWSGRRPRRLGNPPFWRAARPPRSRRLTA